MTVPDHLHRRYPGVRSFDDDEIHRRLFRGRDQESYDLLQMVLAERLAVLFSRSGVGKSSIINAGLMEPLREQGYFPMVVRISGVEDDPLESFYRGIKAACDRGIERNEIDAYEPDDPKHWDRSSLWHFFKTFYIWRGEKLLQPVIILDQFEELFTLVSEGTRKRFVSEFADLVRGRRPRDVPDHGGAESELSDRPPDLKVVLSIREDFMANLEELAEPIPGILKSRFRLLALDRDQARRAISEPSSLEILEVPSPPFTWSDEALECVLDFLCQRKTNHGATEIGTEVEPFQLQLICQFVEDIVRKNDLKAVSGGDLGGPEALGEILTRFYKDSVDALSKRFPHRKTRRRIEKLCEFGLITGKGRRLLREESTINESDHVSPEMLTEMVQLRLIRKEPRVGDNYYELTHDTLIGPILASRERRESWRRRRRNLVTGIVAAGALTALGLTWYFSANTVVFQQREDLVQNPGKIRSIIASGVLQVGPSYGPLEGGQQIEETLTSQSRLDDLDDLIAAAWDLPLPTRRSLVISMSSTAVDSYLVVLLPNGEILTNDDAVSGNLDAEVFANSDPGTIRVVATSYSGLSTGAYTLTVRQAEDLTRETLASPDEIAKIPRGSRLPQLQTQDSLTRIDTYRGLVLKSWTWPLEAPATTAIELTSTDFDAYLVVELPNGEVLVNDDYGDSNRNARLEFGADAGDLRIIATSLSGTEIGQYTISVSGTGARITHDDLYSTEILNEIPSEGELTIGEPRAGQLLASHVFRGMNLTSWRTSLGEPGPVEITLSSPDFDTYLVVLLPSGEVRYNDDFPIGERDSQLTFDASPGDYRIFVASYAGNATGRYEISFARPSFGTRTP